MNNFPSTRRPRSTATRRAAAGAVLVGLLVVSGALGLGALGLGCTVSRSGLKPQQCITDAQCDDGNPCATAACSALGQCVVTPIADGTVLDAQVIGDCTRVECLAGEVVETLDELDRIDDNNACTDDLCTETGPTHESLPDGTPCEDSGGNTGGCEGGSCIVSCTGVNAEVRCDDGNACTTDSCDTLAGRCVHDALDGVPAQVERQTSGDCKIVVCELGEESIVNDNADRPDDGNSCTEDTCNDGVPVNAALSMGSECADGGGKVCNGDASPDCVECNVPADCATFAFDDECVTTTCEENVCGVDLTAEGTALSLQSDGDCKVVVCDGAGKIRVDNDNDDEPDDANDCTGDTCVAGVPTHAPLALDAPCGATDELVCDGKGSCVGCNADAQCDADLPCRDFFCSPANTCEFRDIPLGTLLPAADQVPGDCRLLQCDGAGDVEDVPADNDLPDDDNECTADECDGGMVEHPNLGLNTPCDQDDGSFCDGMGACVECNDASQCEQGEPCETALCDDNACLLVDTDAGVAAPPSEQTAEDCQLVECDGNGNTVSVDADADRPDDDDDCTRDECAGSPLEPSHPAEDAGVACDQDGGQVCNGDLVMPLCVECVEDEQCVAPDVCQTATHTCKLDAGEGCLDGGECASTFCTDAVCCATACSAPCDTCDASGTCVLRGEGVSGDPVCAEGTVCDGATASCPVGCVDGADCESSHYCIAGSCIAKGAQGAACLADGECLSGACADNRCCDQACDGDCEACNLTGMEGTCTPLSMMTECRAAAGICDAAESCDGVTGDCPTDEMLPATFECREATGLCDAAESCDGLSATCPDDEVLPATAECRPALDPECDVAENCNGSTKNCPTDVVASIATACGDGVAEPTCNPDHCNGGGLCVDEPIVDDLTICMEVEEGECLAGVCQ